MTLAERLAHPDIASLPDWAAAEARGVAVDARAVGLARGGR